MKNIHERIEKVIKELKMNNNSFSKKIGLSSATVINNITGGRFSKPSFDVIESIVLTFPQIDANWLITGQGEMYKPTAQPEGPRYVNHCSNCEHKQEMIDLQKGRIETLQELCRSKDEMIRELRAQLDQGKITTRNCG